MLLTDLPEEILIIIIQKLDINSVQNLYNTCKTIKNIVCMHGVIKRCCLSRNVCATANTFKLDFYKDISLSVQELNVSGVPDLSKTSFIPAVKKLKNLKVLDISFTNLDILDILEIYKVCPTIIDITINFQCAKFYHVSKEIKFQCQSVFSQFKNINFVGPLINLLCARVLMFLVAKADMHHFKYTGTEGSNSFDMSDSILVNENGKVEFDTPKFDKFTAYIINWKYKSTPDELVVSLSDFPILSLYNSDKYAYVIFVTDEFDTEIYASPMFHEFFKDVFDITTECAKSDINLSSNMAFMFWNISTTEFDKKFYDSLENITKSYYPCYFASDRELPSCENDDWFYTIPSEVVQDKSEPAVKKIGKKRVAAPTHLLNYDDMFKDKENIELTILFQNPINCAIALTTGCEYLKNLSYLSLVNFRRYTSDFFNVLFRCCINLITLNVEGFYSPPCASAIARCLPLSKSIKNLRLVDRSIDFKSLFTSFIQCPTIENVHIIDDSALRNDLADPTLVVDQCHNLHSVYIEGEISDRIVRKTTQLFQKAKKRYSKQYMNVKIITKINAESLQLECNYDPFMHVFKLYPIRPI